jgi:hypothetical protein
MLMEDVAPVTSSVMFIFDHARRKTHRWKIVDELPNLLVQNLHVLKLCRLM